MAATESSRLLTLDGMRGLAAIAVVLSHLDFVGPLAPSGYLAVDFFFVMSGVVIARAYQGKFERGLPFGNFLAERFIRLYPLYFVGLLIGIAHRIGQIGAHNPHQMSWSDLGASAIFNLMLLPSPMTEELGPLNGPSWSLFLELLVNVIWAAALVKMSTRKLIVYVLFTGLALCFAILAKGSANFGFAWLDVHIGIARSFFGFGLGVVLARYFGQRRPRSSTLSLLPALALCVVLVTNITPKFRALYDLVAIFICFPAIVWAGVTFDPTRTLRSAAHALGDMSYPVYIMHLAPLYTLGFFARKFNWSPLLWIPLFILGICALSLLLSRTFDPFARRLLSAIEARRRMRSVKLLVG